ncbi:MAG: hypothetical protein LBR27_10515 [Bifidobacteriaceae bacterium]|jgi:hypothetical protein|nr:hypothetical protein [Bifidobacteriaceae bacterium]
MATPTLLPVYLEPEPSATFHRIFAALKDQAGDLATWLEPVQIAQAPGIAAEAIVVPDFSGKVYGQLAEFQAIADRPILLTTSEHATVFMWDWEGRDWLRRRGVNTLAPNNRQEFHDLLRALAVKAELPQATMLAYWDDLGAGMQPDIFKRFFWWEDECSELMRQRLGITVVKKSFRGLVARADAVPEARVEAELAKVEASGLPISGGLARQARTDAIRIKLALEDELDEAPGVVIAAGINCLNESETSVTTPCFAWNQLFAERGLIWGCESDLTSMVTEYLVNKTLGAPVMMSNLYPFVSGQAALDHERIPYFPQVPGNPENYILAAHCGFFGLVPQAMATRWELREPVLAIVNRNSNAIDADMATGDVTLVKIASTMDALAVTPAELVRYEQYADSDCLNGGVLKVANGPAFVEHLPSHHYVIAGGALERRLGLVSQVLGLDNYII